MLLTRKCRGTDRDRVKGRGYQNWLQCYDGKFVVPIFLTKRRYLARQRLLASSLSVNRTM